ncbi:MAG: hypothetical protein U1F11_02840 [Steroidobacteraceae bacterium]
MAVPWVQILKWVPPILDLSRELLQQAKRLQRPQRPSLPPPVELPPAATPRRSCRRRPGDPRAAPARHGARGERGAPGAARGRDGAQLAKLSEAVVVLHRRQRWALLAIVVLIGGLVYLAQRGG